MPPPFHPQILAGPAGAPWKIAAGEYQNSNRWRGVLRCSAGSFRSAFSPFARPVVPRSGQERPDDPFVPRQTTFFELGAEFAKRLMQIPVAIGDRLPQQPQQDDFFFPGGIRCRDALENFRGIDEQFVD